MAPVYDELRRIYDRDGVLLSRKVVEEARPEGSPLHDHFEWDDNEAAERYRRVQAGELIRKVHVRITTSKGRSERVRAFVNIQPSVVETASQDVDDNSTGYIEINDAIQNDQSRELLVEQMQRDLNTFRKRYDVISDLVEQEFRRVISESA